jgi:hypothetical protein
MRGRPEAGAQRHGVREVVATDDLEHERVPRGRVQRERDPLDEAEGVELPHRDGARQGEHAERRRLQGEDGLQADHQPAEVDAVGERAAHEREHGDREGLHERERADRERRAGQVEDEPVRGDLLHPRPDERDAVAGEVEAVVAVPPKAAEGAVAERCERDGGPQGLTRARTGRSGRRARTRSPPAR